MPTTAGQTQKSSVTSMLDQNTKNITETAFSSCFVTIFNSAFSPDDIYNSEKY